MKHIYYAKSQQPNGRRPTCKEHISQVAVLAAEYGGVFGQALAAELAGHLHDFGKYGMRFEGVLHGTQTGVDHALPGATLLMSMAKDPSRYAPVIEAVNGHHDGLLSYESLKGFCALSRTEDAPISCNGGKAASLAGQQDYREAIEAFAEDFPCFRLTNAHGKSLTCHDGNRLRDMLYTRMIFSCLVDADYSVSAEDETPGYISSSADKAFDPEMLLARLNAYVAELKDRSTADENVNALRNELFRRCGEAGNLPGGLFTLTAPTGTGKTLALLHFALRQCVEHDKKRIIIVLPFLTLAEQNADTYANIIENILIDHSQSELDDEARVFAERWSSPFIITTSVKFFEALFAKKPTDCRKLHNIADSVVIFDEAQSLPPELTAATLEAVNSLCEEYHCTMLFSTATQPSFDALPGVSWRPTEINPTSCEMFNALRRTKVEWRVKTPTPLCDIADEMARKESVCTIVNRRDHARKLYRRLCEKCGKDEVFFLTTDLCPHHRSNIVSEIKCRLSQGKPCRVVATQCIEAGLDLDFAVLYRALAPLDAIIQAAGRCNRNGKLPGMGRVVVFLPDEEYLYPSTWYANAAQLVSILLARHEISIHSPEDIKAYYSELFKRTADSEALTQAIKRKDYAATAAEYRLIKEGGLRVLVPAPGKEVLYERLRADALANGITKLWMRESASITVSTFDAKQLALHAENLKYAGKKAAQKSDFYVLLAGHSQCYSQDMGLQFEGVRPEQYIY